MTGILLAGGKSRRMGQDKRTLKIGGDQLLTRVIQVFEELFPEILIVVADISPVVAGLNHRVVTDLIPNRATAGGLYTGLFHSTHSYAFAAACDMPFLDPRIIRKICAEPLSSDVVMVRLATGLQPMHSRYSKRCLPVLEEMIKGGNLRLQDIATNNNLSVNILDEESIRELDPQFRSFLNVNTLTDLEMAEKMCRH